MTKTWPGTQPFGECVIHPMDQGLQPTFLGMSLTSIAFVLLSETSHRLICKC